MRQNRRFAVLAVYLLAMGPPPARADCAADCSAAYRRCRGNPDTCLSQQGVCLSRCGAASPRHGAIAYSERKEVYGYSADEDSAREAAAVAMSNCRQRDAGAGDCKVMVTFRNACGAVALGERGAYGLAWGHTQREATAKALAECRPHGGASCKIDRRVCSGAR